MIAVDESLTGPSQARSAAIGTARQAVRVTTSLLPSASANLDLNPLFLARAARWHGCRLEVTGDSAISDEG